MIRLLFFFLGLAALAFAGVWLVQHPGHVDLDWLGYTVQMSAALLLLLVAGAAIVAWIVIRTILGAPSFFRFAARRRSRDKGYAALSRGLVAVGAGDARTAARASTQASRHLKDDALAMMLEAQAAHLRGDGDGAARVYGAMAQRDDTRPLGLRGLHGEASRRGDDEAARRFAAAAHAAMPLPWSAQAVLDAHTNAGDWERALTSVEGNVAAKLVDKTTGERQRAVLEAAIARDKEDTAPAEALALAQSAIRRAPDLAPPVVVAARVLSRRGDIRKAAKLVENAWQSCQHPDVAQAFLDVRPGDSTSDRLARARTLMSIRSSEPISRLTVARAALANTDYAAARVAMDPLVGEGQRPTVRMCLTMAEIEEAEHGDIGLWREWLDRASRATLDPAWIADGIVYERWEPASPTTGKLDAFRWQVPAERVGPAMDALPPRRQKAVPSSTGPALAPPPALLGTRAMPGDESVADTAKPAPPAVVVSAPPISPPVVDEDARAGKNGAASDLVQPEIVTSTEPDPFPAHKSFAQESPAAPIGDATDEPPQEASRAATPMLDRRAGRSFLSG